MATLAVEIVRVLNEKVYFKVAGGRSSATPVSVRMKMDKIVCLSGIAGHTTDCEHVRAVERYLDTQRQEQP
jgi:hypothetical protein